MLEHLNLLWFASLNASAGLTGVYLLAALFAAERLILLVPVCLIGLWLTGAASARAAAVCAAVATAAALACNTVIGLLWVHPRPFVSGVGHTFLQHAPDSSFPSDHATIMFTVALVLLRAASPPARRAGLALVPLALLTAWARVFIGVHFPLDMLGALAVALVITFVFGTAALRAACGRVHLWAEALYRRLLARPIARGWLPR